MAYKGMKVMIYHRWHDDAVDSIELNQGVLKVRNICIFSKNAKRYCVEKKEKR